MLEIKSRLMVEKFGRSAYGQEGMSLFQIGLEQLFEGRSDTSTITCTPEMFTSLGLPLEPTLIGQRLDVTLRLRHLENIWDVKQNDVFLISLEGHERRHFQGGDGCAVYPSYKLLVDTQHADDARLLDEGRLSPWYHFHLQIGCDEYEQLLAETSRHHCGFSVHVQKT